MEKLGPPDKRRAAIERRFPAWDVMTISSFHDRATEEFAERPLILTADRSLTYRGVQEQSRRIASGLIAAGAKAGDHIALNMANFPEFILVKLAISRAGCTCVPVNFLLHGDALAYVLAQSDSRFLITMDAFRGHDYLADLATMSASLPALEATFAFQTGEESSEGAATIEHLSSLATPQSNAELGRREAAADGNSNSDIIYTSGTTGRPKGVVLTHDMVLRAAYSSVLTRAFEDGRRIQFAMPMYHVFGYVECFIASLFVGGAVIPHTTFDPSEMLDWAARLGSNDIVCVPVMTSRLIDQARNQGFEPPALHTIFNSGGVNVPTVWAEIRSLLRAQEIHTGYGMSETTASTVCTRVEDGDGALIHSNGRTKLAGIAGDLSIGGLIAEYRVADPKTGALLPHGRSGELQVRGPVVTRGYYKKPEETRSAFTDDGWLHTGDIGQLDEQGWLTLTGRIKESYRCGGEMVMPREIEELFDGFPGVAQALVVGIPDSRMGEVGCLCVVASGEDRPTDDDLISVCNERLARFKIPKYVLWLSVEDIPLTVTGRPQKFRLAELAANRVNENHGRSSNVSKSG